MYKETIAMSQIYTKVIFGGLAVAVLAIMLGAGAPMQAPPEPICPAEPELCQEK